MARRKKTAIKAKGIQPQKLRSPHILIVDDDKKNNGEHAQLEAALRRRKKNSTDLTERERITGLLENEHLLLRTLIDTLPETIYVKDAHHRFISDPRDDAQNQRRKDHSGRSVFKPRDLLGK